MSEQSIAINLKHSEIVYLIELLKINIKDQTQGDEFADVTFERDILLALKQGQNGLEISQQLNHE